MKKNEFLILIIMIGLLLAQMIPSVYPLQYSILFFALSSILLISMTASKNQVIRIGYSTLLTILFLCFVAIRSYGRYSVVYLNSICCIAVLFSNHSVNFKAKTFTNLFFSIYTLEYIVCILQITFHIMVVNDAFVFTGTFDNPNALSLILCVGLPFLLAGFENTNKRNILILCFIIANSAIILICKSRIAVLIYSGYLFVEILKNKDRIFNFFKKKFNNTIITILCVVLFSGIMGTTILMEKGSNLGRFFILQRTLNLSPNFKLFGNGEYYFRKEYMLEQAKYFETNENNIFSEFADNVAHPLNEYISIWLSYGLVGIFMLCILVTAILSYKDQINNIFKDSLAIILLYSMFFYSFRYPIVLFLICTFVLKLNNHKSIFDLSCKYTRVLGLLLFIVVSVNFIKGSYFQIKWDVASLKYESRPYSEKTIKNYEELYKINRNPYFLYNYARLLYDNLYFDESLKILKEYNDNINDYDSELLIANNYLAKHDYQRSLD